MLNRYKALIGYHKKETKYMWQRHIYSLEENKLTFTNPTFNLIHVKTPVYEVEVHVNAVC